METEDQTNAESDTIAGAQHHINCHSLSCGTIHFPPSPLSSHEFILCSIMQATLSETNFFTIISAGRYGIALDLYLVHLKQTNDVVRLIRLYQHLER